MTVKTFWNAHHNRNLHLGRKRPSGLLPKLHLKKYLKVLPPAPASCDYTAKAARVLGQMFLNADLGICVPAGAYHILGTWLENVGQDFIATDPQLITDYSAIGGYVPGNPNTDQGCDEQTALKYWTDTGFADGSKLVGWLAVNPQDQTEYQTALYLFENLYFGLELPDSWLTVAPGFTWDQATPNPSNGHCIAGFGYNAQGVTVSTWGMLGTLTHRALQSVVSARYGGELYVLVSQDMINKAIGKAPSGLDWPTLIADFDSLGGNIPVPSPNPVPPSPVPPAPVPPAPNPFSWWTLLQFIEAMLKQFGPAIEPVLIGFLEQLQLPAVIITILEDILKQYLGRRPMVRWQRAEG